MNSDYVTIIKRLVAWGRRPNDSFDDLSGIVFDAEAWLAEREKDAPPETSPSPCRCGAKADFIGGPNDHHIVCSRPCSEYPDVAGPDPARVLAAWNVLVGKDEEYDWVKYGAYSCAKCDKTWTGQRFHDCRNKNEPDPVEEK